MRKFFIPKVTRFKLIFLFLFLLGTLLVDNIIIQSVIHNAKGNENQIFYWLSPKLSLIQTGNLILLVGGIISFLSGVFVPKIRAKDFKTQLLYTIPYLILLNIECIVISAISTYFYETIFVPPLEVQYNFNIIQHSTQMFLALLLFLSFWSCFGYGLRLTFSFITPAFIIGIAIQLGEYFFVFAHKPSFEKYLPLGLSRQLVINQFPFWRKGSWADIPNVVPIGSTPMLVDDRYNFTLISYWWIVVFLIWYLAIVYIVPIFREIYNNDKILKEKIGG
jgi:hypothetical protein